MATFLYKSKQKLQLYDFIFLMLILLLFKNCLDTTSCAWNHPVHSNSEKETYCKSLQPTL